MARGFGARGIGGTDIIVGSFGASNTARTHFFYSNRTGDGGGGFGRFFCYSDVLNAGLYYDSGAGLCEFRHVFSGSLASWTFTAPSANTWHTIGISYDPSSTANDPIVYVDGVSVTVTESVAPSGSANIDTGFNLRIGNRNSQDRVYDGDLARFAIWNSILDATQHASLAAGTLPTSIGSVAYYVSLSSSTTPEVGTNLSVTGTQHQNDPIFGTGYAITADAGSYSISGQIVDLLTSSPATYNITADPGSYTITGVDSFSNLAMNADVGTYSITGQDALFQYIPSGGYNLTADAGIYSMTGQDIILDKTGTFSYSLSADAEIYSMNGVNVRLLWSNAPVTYAKILAFRMSL